MEIQPGHRELKKKKSILDPNVHIIHTPCHEETLYQNKIVNLPIPPLKDLFTKDNLSTSKGKDNLIAKDLFTKDLVHSFGWRSDLLVPVLPSYA